MRLLYWLLTAPLLVFAISFTISNREDVSLSLLPLPFEITVPIAVIGLIAMLFGAIIGMLITWANGAKTRSRARAAERNADEKSREIENLNQQIHQLKDTQQNIAAPNLPQTTKALSDS